MRRLTEPQAHRARVGIIEGDYPEDLRARCALCRRVLPVGEGRFVEAKRHAAGPSKVFVCADCGDQLDDAAA